MLTFQITARHQGLCPDFRMILQSKIQEKDTLMEPNHAKDYCCATPCLLWVANTLLSAPIGLLECEVSYCQLLDTRWSPTMQKTTVAQLLALLWVPNTLLSDPIELLECEVSYCQLLDTSVLRFWGPIRRMSKFWKYGKIAIDC